MPDWIAKRLTVLIVAAYVVSVGLCACRTATVSAPAAEHRCCHAKRGSTPLHRPSSQDHSHHCPHCGGAQFATAPHKQVQADHHIASAVVAPVPLADIPSTDQPALSHPVQNHFSPPNTLLRLHCALTT